MENHPGRFRPEPSQLAQPENPQPPQEGGNGSPGLPPTIHERAKPPPESRERQPLPSVLDILERRAQLQEERERVSQQLGPYVTHARRAMLVEYSDKEIDLGKELQAVHDSGTDRDRLIIDVYRTMTTYESGEPVPWSMDLPLPRHIRQFISRVAPMSNEEFAEELRKAQKMVERRTQANRKRRETREANKGLTWAERHEKLLEAGRRRYHERKEQRRLQAEQQQSTQVFPPPQE